MITLKLDDDYPPPEENKEVVYDSKIICTDGKEFQLTIWKIYEDKKFWYRPELKDI